MPRDVWHWDKFNVQAVSLNMPNSWRKLLLMYSTCTSKNCKVFELLGYKEICYRAITTVWQKSTHLETNCRIFNNDTLTLPIDTVQFFTGIWNFHCRTRLKVLLGFSLSLECHYIVLRKSASPKSLFVAVALSPAAHVSADRPNKLSEFSIDLLQYLLSFWHSILFSLEPVDKYCWNRVSVRLDKRNEKQIDHKHWPEYYKWEWTKSLAFPGILVIPHPEQQISREKSGHSAVRILIGGTVNSKCCKLST